MGGPTSLLPLLLLAACAGRNQTPSAPTTWPTGEFTLEASISYSQGGGTAQDSHIANLSIDADGTMSLSPNTALCQDPSPSQLGEDQARGRRTFVCGETRYELRPAGATVRGDLYATVQEEVVRTVCVEFRRNPDGTQVCVRTQEVRDRQTVVKRAPLRVVAAR